MSRCWVEFFTKLINTRVEAFSEKNRILLDNQAGFRKKHSTTDQVFVIQNLVDIFLNRGKRLYMAWVDYAKAFYKVWRQGLFYKMLKQGIPAKIVNIVKSIYSNNKSKVMVNGELSNAFLSFSGVRQGESLSPFLFAIYLNDLEDFRNRRGCEYTEVNDNEETLLRLMLVLYADDTAIIAESAHTLQKGPTALVEFSSRWNLSINVRQK